MNKCVSVRREQEQVMACLLMAMLMAPAHDAKLMVGHGKRDMLLKDAASIVVELLGDINATGDWTPGVDL